MCGYAAPKIDTVRVGFIGPGQRGQEHLKNMIKLKGVEIIGLCDIRSESVLKAKKSLDVSSHNPCDLLRQQR